MSLVNKYRKQPDGFLKLIQLIESSEPETQKNILHLVGSDDPGWAHLIKTKAITPERILTWPNSVLRKIFSKLNIPQISALYSTLNEEHRSTVLNAIQENQIRPVQDYTLDHPSEKGQIIAARIFLVQIVRDLEARGQLHFKDIDPALTFDKRLAVA